MLSEFLRTNRDEIISRTRSDVLDRATRRSTDAESRAGIPLFFEQLIELLGGGSPGCSPEIVASATRHGSDLLRAGFSVGQVVHEYGGLCQAITQVADERHALITNREFHLLNGCLDDAIAHAATELVRQREQPLSREGLKSLGVLAHELRSHLHVANLAKHAIRSRAVGASGRMEAMLDRSLRGMSALIEGSFDTVRLRANVLERERIVVAELIEEVSVGAALEANLRHLRFSVGPVDHQVSIEANRRHLASALANLLGNAFKFTRPGSHVDLRTRATPDRVRIEIADECGGLPPAPTELFDSFAQRGTDRTGLGLGLSISRRAIEESGGTLDLRDLPGVGCIFTVDLPRVTAVAAMDAPAVG
jgi:hypothetical protein